MADSSWKEILKLHLSTGAAAREDEEMREAGPLPEERNNTAGAAASPAPQQRSKVVKSGDKRSKKGKRRINSGGPPPLARDDYVRVVPVSKRSEVSVLIFQVVQEQGHRQNQGCTAAACF